MSEGIQKPADKKLSRAHVDVLNMLKLIDDFCIQEGIIYTLAEDTMIAYGFVDFSCQDPAISIAVEYSGFKKILDFLNRLCEKDPEYSVHSYRNTRQFYTPCVWFVKKSRVALAEKRKEEAFYYGSHITIIPLYYAGDTKKDWKKMNRFYAKTILPCYYRNMVPKRPFLIKLRMIPRILRMKKMLRLRDFAGFDKNIEVFENNEPSEYVYFPVLTTKYSGINTMLDVMPDKIADLTRSSYWKNVERISYSGIDCYILKDRERLLSLYRKSKIKGIRNTMSSNASIMNGEDLRRVQLIQLELLREFDRICRKYDLKYNINFGTLIGAVRHKGFVPWDDDIDITMYYEDCRKLYEIMDKELDQEKYFYRCAETEKYHHVIINHLEHKGTVFTQPGRDKLEHKIGIFIDIFPLYPAAPNRFVDFLHTRVCRFWRRAMWSTVAADSEKNPVKRSYYKLLSHLGTERCRRYFEKEATRFPLKKGRLKLWTLMERSPFDVDLLRMDNFDEALEMDFEGLRVLAPKHYVESMEFCFSKDWELYPDIGMRKMHHNVLVDIGDLYSYENS